MTPEQKARWATAWEQTRSRGKKRYVLIEGVLKWGGTMFILMTIFSFYNQPADALLGKLGIIVINLIVWPIGGMSFGLAMWRYFEHQYRRYRSQSQ